MSSLRVVILVSGTGRTLQNFIDLKRANPAEPWEIVLVIGSKYGLQGIDRAIVADIATSVVDRKSFDNVMAFSDTIFRLCDGVRADLVLLAGWLHLLRIPAAYEGRVINIHPALLPKFGGKGMFGRHVHEAVLAAGEVESGCTVHLVNNEYDSGPVLAQRKCPVLSSDTPDTLAARVFEQECLAFPDVVRAMAARK